MPPLSSLATSPWLLAAMAMGCVAGAAVARRVGLSARTSVVLAPAITLAGWLTLTLAVARATGSFRTGVGAAGLAVALAGLWHLARPRPALVGRWRPSVDDAWIAAVTVGLVALVVPAARYHFHDETSIAGHASTAARLLRDHYPPPFPSFPEWEFRYHYGFDVLSAAIAGALGATPSEGIDLATLGLWGYAAPVAARLGEVVWSRRSGALVALGALLGGGAQFLGAPDALRAGERWMGAWRIEGLWLNPPTSSYVFQHPFALGIPLALAMLVVHAEAGRGVARWLLLGGLAIALAHAQLVLFLTVAGSIALGEAARVAERRERPLARLALLGLVAIGATFAASRLGGFFSAGPRGLSGSLAPSGTITGTLGGSARWFAHTFGALPILGALGLARARAARVALITLVLGSLTVLVSVRYAESWDIVKFSTVAQLALGAGAGAVVAQVIGGGGGARARWARGLAGLALLTATIAGGAAFHVAVVADLEGATTGDVPERPTRDDACAIAALSPRAGRTELVYRARGAALAYAQAGLGSVWPDYPTRQFGIPPALIEARESLLAGAPDDVEEWKRAGIRWWVVRDGRERVAAAAARWRDAGSVEEVARCGDLVVLRAR